MVSIYERISQYLLKCSEPAGIADFLSDPNFEGMTRADLNETLLAMCQEGTIHRCLRQGKALYTTKPMEDEITNPCADNIRNLQSIIDATIGLAQGKPLYSFDDLAVENGNTLPELTYNEGRLIDNEEYSIAIPDGFRVKENIDDRAFIAWLPNEEDPDDYECGRIVLFDAPLNPMNTQEHTIHLPESMCAMTEAAIWSIKSKMDMLSDTTVFSIREGEAMGAMMLDEANAHLQLGTVNALKQMRVLNNSYSLKQRVEFADFVRRWIGTIHFKKQLPPIMPMDDKTLMNSSLTEQKLKEIIDCANKWDEQIKILSTFQFKAIESEWTYRQSKGVPSVSALMESIRSMQKMLCEKWEDVACRAAALMVYYSEHDPENALLANLYGQFEEIIFSQSHWQNNIDDKPIITVFEKVKEAAERAKTPAVQKMMEIHRKKLEQDKLKREREEKAKAMKSECDACISKFYDELEEARSNRENRLNEVYEEFIGLNENQIYLMKSKFRSVNNLGGNSMARAYRTLDTTAKELFNRGAGLDFVNRIISIMESVQDELDLQVDIDLGYYGELEIKYDVSQDLLNLPQKWENIRNNHPDIIAERKKQKREKAIKQLHASIADLKKQLASLEQEKESRQEAAAKARNAFAENETTFADRLNCAKEEAERIIRIREADLQEAQTVLSEHEQQRRDAANELEKTFFLAFGKKKVLREMLAHLETSLHADRHKADECKRLVDNAVVEQKASLTAIQKEHDYLKEEMEKTDRNEKMLPVEIADVAEKIKKNEAELEAKLKETAD